MERCARRYGDVFTVRLAQVGTFVFTTDPETLKQVFTARPDRLRAGEANVALEPVLGNRSVLLLDGAEHLRQRRLMLPPFHGERLRGYERADRRDRGGGDARLAARLGARRCSRGCRRSRSR